MAKPIPEMPSSVFVALVGRPNVGKSSLTNYLVGEKVAIVTKKPQTTRSRITGVITKGPVQYVLMDTPGIHAARMDIEELLGVKVNLQCWVKVREDWRDNELQLNSLGFAKP